MVKYKIKNGQIQVLQKGSKEPGSKYIDGILKENLDHIKKLIKKDWDYVFVIDGEVGSGKSVLAQQLAYYCSNGKLTIDQIVFTPKEFQEAVKKAPKYSTIVFDEAFRGLSRSGAMTHVNNAIKTMLQEIRQKNLFIFVCIPSAWDLDNYVVLHRAKGVFHVYTGDGKERGFCKFYANKENESSGSYFKRFFTNRRNRYSYPKHSAIPPFRFTDGYCVDEEAYRKKKLKALHESPYSEHGKVGKKSARRIRRKELLGVNFRLMKEFPDMTQKKRAKILGCAKKTLVRWEKLGDPDN